MIKVFARQNESFERLLGRFNAAVKEDGILKLHKEKSVYEKPSVKKRRIKKQREMERYLVK